MGRLDGKVAIVTGASRGIGAAAAVGFARQGASVAVNTLPGDHWEALAAGVVDRITAAGGRGMVIPADVSDPAAVTTMVERVAEAFGDPDVLVSNAVHSVRGPWHEIPVEQWDRTMAVNLRGSLLGAQAVRDGMLRKGGGSIINLTSVTAETGQANFLDYVSSKAGIIGFTRALAREAGPDNIRVNAVMPGAIRTEQEVELGGDEQELAERAAGRQSLSRRGYAEDLVGAFVFLASDESSFITGQVINVDGGWVMY